MPTQADVLRHLLIANVVARKASDGWAVGQWPITTGGLPSGAETKYDQFIAVRDTGFDIDPDANMRTGKNVEWPTVQLLVRGGSKDIAWDKINEVKTLCHRVGTPPPDGLGWVAVVDGAEQFVLKSCRVVSGPAWLRDEEANRRVVYVMNLRLKYHKREA